MKIRFIILFTIMLGLNLIANAQSSGTFCVDLNQVVKYAAGKFEIIKGSAISGKTIEYNSKLTLAGTMSATIKPGPEPGTIHYLSPMSIRSDLKATLSFRDQMISMTQGCLEAMGYTVKPSKVLINGEEAFEATFFSLEFPASKNMKIQVYVVKNPAGNKIMLDLIYKE